MTKVPHEILKSIIIKRKDSLKASDLGLLWQSIVTTLGLAILKGHESTHNPMKMEIGILKNTLKKLYL